LSESAFTFFDGAIPGLVLGTVVITVSIKWAYCLEFNWAEAVVVGCVVFLTSRFWAHVYACIVITAENFSSWAIALRTIPLLTSVFGTSVYTSSFSNTPFLIGFSADACCRIITPFFTDS